MTPADFILMISVPGLLTGIWWVQQRRDRAMKSLAIRLNFHYLGAVLPRTLTIREPWLNEMTSTRNVIDGERNSIRVVAFDCRIGYGKGSSVRTVVAAKAARNVFVSQTNRDLFRSVTSDDDLTVSQSGDWILLYRPKQRFELKSSGLIPIDELEMHINSIA
jgi:hypothetical protein